MTLVDGETRDIEDSTGKGQRSAGRSMRRANKERTTGKLISLKTEIDFSPKMG